MEIKLKQRKGSNVISRYKHFLRELYEEIFVPLQLSVEEISIAKINAIPKDLLYSNIEVVNPEIVILTLDNKLRIVDYDRSIDIRKLSLRYSEFRMIFFGYLRDIRAVFHVNIEYTGRGWIGGYTNDLDFDDFDQLLKKVLIN